MASLDAEEALLKKKLEDTENLDDRREIRKQLRELRNKKFEEEMKKVTANDYRPGRTKTALSNGIDSKLSSVGRKGSVEDEEDVHGINHLETEEDLQALLNETPFTETEKRKKIRARIREIRNHKLGLGDPVIIKRPTREERLKETTQVDKENDSRYITNNKREAKGSPRDESVGVNEYSSSYSSRRSNRNRDALEESSTKESKEVANDNDAGAIDLKEALHDNDSVEAQSPVLNNKLDTDDEPSVANENEVGNEKEVEVVDENNGEMGAGIHRKEDMEEVEKVEAEAGVEGAPCDEDKVVNGYGEEGTGSINDDFEDDLANQEDVDSRSRGSSIRNDALVDEEDEVETEDLPVSEDAVHNYKAADDEEDLESYDEDKIDNEDEYKEELAGGDVEYSDHEEEDEPDNGDPLESGVDKRDRGYSAEDDDYYLEDEVDDAELYAGQPESTEKASDFEDYSDEEALSENEDYDEDEEKEERYQESAAKEDKRNQNFSDDYSEGYSDHTATDEGSSVTGRKYDDDQDLAGYEFDRQLSERKAIGTSYSAKVDEVFRQKEPALAEGKSFKELLKKSDKSPMEKPTGGKRGAEQVDFRTVLRSTEKSKKSGERSTSNVEQVDFRNLLQKKVKTRTLADKEIGAEQVDFRTVLRQNSISSDKKEVSQRKTSSAEQLDFRNVLKKQPSIQSRKLSVEEKNEMIKSIRAGKDVGKNEGNTSSEKPGRTSLDSLRQGGGVGRAKNDLNKNLKEDADSGKTQRKAGRPSLDALKQSGELGKTEDKRGVFERASSKGKKTPGPVPPKSNAKTKVNEDIEKKEPELSEESAILEEDEPEAEITNDHGHANETRRVSKPINKHQKGSVEVPSRDKRKTSIENKEKRPNKTTVEISSNATVEKPRSRRRNEDLPKNEAGKEESRPGKVSLEGDERRSPTKSGDKRARNRRLRQDQNEVLKAQTEEVKIEKEEVNKSADAKSKSSSLERVAVVQSTASRPTVQVILSTKSSGEKNKADDSDDEGIGSRRNRRRLVRKESLDEQDGGRVSVRTVAKKDQKAEEKKDVEREDKKSISTKDNVSEKPSRLLGRRDAGTTARTKTESEKSKAGDEDSLKAAKTKTASLDARLAERRRQRAIESREKQQKARNSRKAFRDQLESSAPTTNGSASPSIQRANSNMTKLLHWCQRMTDGYPNVSVTNFTTSWKDGLAFCALLHNFTPDKISFDDLSSKRPKENFEMAFAAATDEGVPPLLEVEDMVRMECPDPKSVITYIHAIYQEFVTNRR